MYIFITTFDLILVKYLTTQNLSLDIHQVDALNPHMFDVQTKLLTLVRHIYLYSDPHFNWGPHTRTGHSQATAQAPREVHDGGRGPDLLTLGLDNLETHHNYLYIGDPLDLSP